MSTARPLMRSLSGRLCRSSLRKFTVRAQRQHRDVIRVDNSRIFPYLDEFHMEKATLSHREVLEECAAFLTPERIARFRAAASERCFSVLPVVEGLHDVGNIAAVARSADALGFGRLHVIRQGHDKYKLSHRAISAGSDKWLHEQVCDGTTQTLRSLKGMGYRVAVTHLREDAVDIRELDWAVPTAVVLGNEKDGTSDEAVAEADVCLTIPMAGFVESFNVSVAAALVMWQAREDRIRRLGRHSDLTPEQAEVLTAVYCLKSHSRTASWVDEVVSRAVLHGKWKGPADAAPGVRQEQSAAA